MSRIPCGIFGYPGSKYNISPWIVSQMPEHDVYIEPFGGSAAVLFEKEKSQIEIYNDVNSDVVNVFRVIRNQSEELEHFMKNMPYSREEHECISEKWYSGDRPDDDLKRAAWFIFLSGVQFGGKVHTKDSFTSVGEAHNVNKAVREWNRSVSIPLFSERLGDVCIENVDYQELVEKHDSRDTLFYFDPPYMCEDGQYYAQEFDHCKFVETIRDLKSKWIVSYYDIPDGLEDFTIVEREVVKYMSRQYNSGTEKLIMNYDKSEAGKFVSNEYNSAAEW